MKRSLRLILVLVIALVFVQFLPLFIERTMVRSWQINRTGDVVDWGWKVCTLNAFWSDYSYLSTEQEPAFWLTVNLALALIYSLAITVAIDQLLTRRKRRRQAAIG